jgi:hypothetical protein
MTASFHGRLYIGGPECTHCYCGAFFWYAERAVHLSAFTQWRVMYDMCYKMGRVFQINLNLCLGLSLILLEDLCYLVLYVQV